MKNKPDLVFICRKCEHNLFVDKQKFIKDCDLSDCPNCGEEGCENWIFSREGNFDEDFEKMNKKTEIVYVKLPFEKIETIVKTTRRAIKLYDQPKLKTLKKISNKSLNKTFENIFKDLPFEIYFMQTVVDSCYRARPIYLNCFESFEKLSKHEIINDFPLKMKNELITKYENSKIKIKSLGVLLPIYQIKIMSNETFFNKDELCLYGDFEYEQTN